MALPAALGLWICASPCVSHVPSHVPSHVLPRSLPRSGGYATRLLSFAGLQPALPRDPCFISQKCSPAGTCWVASFFRSLSLSITSPGRRPGHRRLRVANPQQRVGVYVWVFSWMCFRVGVYVVANPQQRVGVYVGVFAWECLPPSPATIRLLDFWPRCLDYCQTAAVFVFFNQQRPDKARKFIIFAANGPRR